MIHGGQLYARLCTGRWWIERRSLETLVRRRAAEMRWMRLDASRCRPAPTQIITSAAETRTPKGRS